MRDSRRSAPIRAAALAAAWAGLLQLACSKPGEPPAPKEPVGRAPQQATGRFYYDLGPPTADVSGYPRRQQENYRLFMAVCGACHTTARPLNSPYTEAEVWMRYVHRMHAKMEKRGIRLDDATRERIVAFLVYDSKVRKIDRGGEFRDQQEKLKRLFEQTYRGERR